MDNPTGAGDNFYRDLDPVDDFTAVTDPARLTPLPDDWSVVVADIRGSTPAIAAGRYKDVNMVGAACIAAALNAVPALDIPYVFGGDGATLAIPETARGAVGDALLRTRRLARNVTGLDLRVGMVPLPEIRARGATVAVARYRLGPGNHLAMFAGGGIEMADRLVKADETGRLAPADDGTEGEPDLEGLSCRWEPLASRRGRMATLMIRAMTTDAAEAAAVYRAMLAGLERLLAEDPGLGRPIDAANMKFRWPPRGLRIEAALTAGGGSRLARRIALGKQSLIQYFLEKFDLSAGDYNAPVYREELRRNTDYRRFDDMLRLVLDCTEDEIPAIGALLAAERSAGRICYGMHLSDSALMTCLVFDLADSRHLHFLDGAGGGFTLAAKQLKEQLAAAAPDGAKDHETG